MDTKMSEDTFGDLGALVEAEEGGKEPRVYELGFHIIPFTDDAQVAGQVETIKNLILGSGAEIYTERAPVKMTLAYPIEKKIEGTREVFLNAHFGWVAFSLAPDALPQLKKAFDAEAGILRYLLIETSKEQVDAIVADPSLDTFSLDGDTESDIKTVGADTDQAREDKTNEEKEKEVTA